MATLLIHSGWVLPCDGDMRQAHRPGYVLVRGERIEAVESGSPPEGLLLRLTKSSTRRARRCSPA